METIINGLTKDELAYQMTAYEFAGCINYKECIVDQIKEELDDNDILSKYRDYLSENCYDDMFYDNDEFFFQDYFQDAMEAVRASYFGNYNFNSAYVRINVYGNLDSIEEFEIVEEAKNNDDFWMYLLENDYSELLEEELKHAVISKALDLVRQGY